MLQTYIPPVQPHAIQYSNFRVNNSNTISFKFAALDTLMNAVSETTMNLATLLISVKANNIN